MNDKTQTIRILLISNDQAGVSDIENHLSEFMRLSWSLMHCVSLKEAAAKMGRADLIILDLGLEGLQTPKEVFDQVGQSTFEIPIIAVTGENESEHNLATYVIEHGAADIIIRGQFGRLVDAIEFALIRQKISTQARQSAGITLKDSKTQAAENLESSRQDRVDDKRKSDQMISWLTGSYSATGSDQ